jgi:CBS domain-containing protein
MKSRLTAADVMSTTLITATPEERIGVADVDMKLARIRHVPVVNDVGDLVGIVSNRDLARALSKKNGNSIEIGQVMSWDVVTASEDTPITEVIETMIHKKIGCLPVLGADRRLVGIVTETDCLQVALDALSE